MAVDLVVWFGIALVFAVQGYVVSTYRDMPQPWWPSFGYSVSIFSVWAILSPLIVLCVRRAEARLSRGWWLAAVCTAGLPVVAALHVAIFALLYWPIYNGDGAIPSRRAMAERMVLANLDTNVLFYAIVIGVTLAWTAHTRRAASRSSEAAASGDISGNPQRLRVRSKGRLQLISTAEVDWIGAADDYAEVHAGGAVHLVETSLAALERQLPAAHFARIHRGTLVRLDRVVEIRGIGRGDALVRLADDTELRLSRRYRANLASVLRPPASAGPAYPGEESLLPIGDGAAS